MTFRLGKFLVLLALCLGVCGVAHADTYQFTISNCSSSCGSSPFGQVDVTQNGTNTVHFVVTLFNNAVFTNTGSGDAFDFNISGSPTISISNIKNNGATSSAFSLVSTSAGSIHTGGNFTFAYAVTCNGCSGGNPNNPGGPLSFDISFSGATPASFKVTSSGSGGPAIFGTDIRASNGNTGPVEAPNTATTPEPGTLALFGAGLVGIAGFVRRRFLK